MAGAYLPPVVVEITGNADGLIAAVARAKAALDALKGSGGDIKLNFDANTASLAKATIAANAFTAATGRGVAGGRRWTNWLAAAHTILTVFGANIVADTIGIIAFGIGAIAAFAPIPGVISSMGQGYAELSPLQQAATDRLTAFIHAFQNANQTGIFAVFNGLMDLVKAHVGSTGGVMDQATKAFESFAAMLRQTFSSGPWQSMLGRSTGVIQQDMTALFHLIQSILGVLPALFHDFNSWGLFAINAAAGILHLVAILGNADPALARFAFGAFAIYRVLRMLGQFQAGSMLSRGIASMGFAMSASAKEAGFLATSIASIKTYGLGTTAFLMTGLLPAELGILGAAGGLAAAILYVNFAFKQSSGPMANFISNLQKQYQATGDNLAGYERYTQALNQTVQGTRQLSQADKNAAATGAARTNAIEQLSRAQQQAQQTTNTLRSNLNYLEQTYHLTQGQAIQLAQATGVNLTQAFAHGGGAAQLARLKIQQYEQTVNAAKNPTTVLGYDLGLAANQALALSDRVQALTNAFNALLTPFANVIQDTANWKTGNLQLESAVDKAKGKVDAMGSSTQRLAAVGLASAINNTVKLSQDTLQQTGSMQKAIGPVQAEIGILQALGSKSSEVAQAIRYLQQYIDSLHSKTITITTILQTLHQNGGSAPTRPGYATGTGSATPGWHMVGEQGPELEYFRGGEKVVPHQASMNMTKGYAGGTGGLSGEQPIVVYLDGKVIYKNIKGRIYYNNTQNNVRNSRGGVVGRMGVR